MRFIAQIIVNALAIFLAAYLVPGIVFEGDILTLLIAGLLLGLANFIFKPLFKIISAPLVALSLGLFIIIINIILLWLVEYFIPELTITGFWSYFWGVLIISIVNMFFGTSRKKKE